MICENCKKNKARAFFNKKSVCDVCFYEMKGIVTKMKDHECVVCGKIFRSVQNPSIPLCSRNCRDKFNRGIKSTQDALNQEYDDMCNGGEI